MNNEVLQQLKSRKSTRVYTKEPITPEEKKAILQAALEAPTAGNMSLYTILDIQDPQKKKILADLCDHQDFIVGAPMVLVFAADYQKWADLFAQYDLPDVPDGPADIFLAMADTFIAAQNAVAAAESLGIGSCYIGDIIENYEQVRDLLQLPRYVLPVCMLVLGKPSESQIRRPKPVRFALEDMVFADEYPDRDAAALEEMFMRKHACTRDQVETLICAAARRKFQADFHQEMNRSVKVMLESWTGKTES